MTRSGVRGSGFGALVSGSVFRIPGLALSLLLLASGGCAGGGGAASRETSILVPIHFYPGHVIGGRNRPTGLQRSADGGRSWSTVTWPELISNSVAVDAGGRWVYLACGNGVMVSEDGGQHFRLTGGWQVNDAVEVAIDRRDPRKAWAATLYGVVHTDDPLGPGNPWKPLPHTGQFRFTTGIVQGRADPDLLLVSSDQGIWRSADGGASFTPVGPRMPVWRVFPDPIDPSHFWAASEGKGILRSVDAGRTWAPLSDAPCDAFAFSRDPSRPGRILCGAADGCRVTDDGGRTWSFAKGMPEGESIMDLEADPEVPGRFLAPTTKGILESRDGGRSWKVCAFEGAYTNDVWIGKLDRSASRPLSDESGRLEIPGRGTRLPEERPEPDADFRIRQASLRRFFLSRQVDSQAKSIDMFLAGALARAGRMDERCWKLVHAFFDKPQHHMFYSHPAMVFRLLAGSRVPPDLEAKIRHALTEVPMFRGDTENHWVMHYTVLLMASQLWPDTPASRWYTGRTTQENYEEAKGWLMHWSRLAARKGQGEFDSPTYMFMFLSPLTLLYDHAEDPEVRQMAGMTLDLLVADYLSESLEGAYCGGHSRADPNSNFRQGSANTATTYHYLYGGGIPLPVAPHGYAIPNVFSAYVPPRGFPEMANRRDPPFVHAETKRLRNAIRFHKELNPPVLKYDYMTRDYCLGSMQGGILQPIQQHTWDVTWRSASEADNPVCFTVNPHYSGYELAMFFGGYPAHILRHVRGHRDDYARPERWVSSSPYEKVFQHENVLLALYDTPPDATHPHVDLYWPRCLAKEEEGGWLFGREGDFRLAAYPCQPGAWSEEKDNLRLRCPGGAPTGFVLVADAGGGEAGYRAFKRRILEGAPPRLEKGPEGPALSCRAGGRDLRFGWSGEGFVDGRPRPFPSDRIFDGPFLRGARDSGVIEMLDGDAWRILDFNKLEVRREPPAARGR